MAAADQPDRDAESRGRAGPATIVSVQEREQGLAADGAS